jgi:CheY-like chemotaxis protein
MNRAAGRLRANSRAPLGSEGIAMDPKPTALVVEDDDIQRSIVALLLEECEMTVIECESADDAARILQDAGPSLSLIYADAHLPGAMSGIELANLARQRFPNLHIVVSSGDLSVKLPRGATFMPKPWRPIDLLREAERSREG